MYMHLNVKSNEKHQSLLNIIKINEKFIIHNLVK